VINPDGGEAGMKHGRKLYVAVQTSEKNFLTFGVETTDKGGHSSRPTNDNPIYRLAAALTRLVAISLSGAFDRNHEAVLRAPRRA
jgi:carboxypeptidase PM20D1